MPTPPARFPPHFTAPLLLRHAAAPTPVPRWPAELGEWQDRVVRLGPDDGRSHGQLCWDGLEPTGLLAVHCRDCRHGPPAAPARVDAALKIGIPPEEIVPWTATTLVRDLVHTSDDGSLRPAAEQIGWGLVNLLGPHADWRANGDAACRQWAAGRGQRPLGRRAARAPSTRRSSVSATATRW
ncbi:hypothetical protein OG871_37745 [Kitasatospora sp. NBC_00374]|uniref:hypothetical protein n=1 Tax=Kitasatospora sp. NBC_00374 TaxID=2975964 RepID=UPI00324C6798